MYIPIASIQVIVLLHKSTDKDDDDDDRQTNALDFEIYYYTIMVIHFNATQIIVAEQPNKIFSEQYINLKYLFKCCIQNFLYCSEIK